MFLNDFYISDIPKEKKAGPVNGENFITASNNALFSSASGVYAYASTPHINMSNTPNSGYINTDACGPDDDDHNYTPTGADGNPLDILEQQENGSSTYLMVDKSNHFTINPSLGYNRHSSSNFYFCSDPTASSLIGRFESVMCFHYFTEARLFVESDLKAINSNLIEYQKQKIIFNPYNQIYETVFISEQNGITYIDFGTKQAGILGNDTAEDAHIILETGFHAYWRDMQASSPTDGPFFSDNSHSDYLFYGILDYITHRNTGDDILIEWGGSNNGVKNREINNALTYNSFDPDLIQSNGLIFTGAMYEISEELSVSKSDFLVYRLMSQFVNDNDQLDAAEMVYNEAVAEYNQDLIQDNNNGINFTAQELCTIASILTSRYGDDQLNIPSTYDFFIRDSYAGQPGGGISQLADIGLEPNTQTIAFSKSPDIWNKLTSDPANDGVHQDPVFNGGALNYLYVDVRQLGCEAPAQDPSARLHVYIKESHLSSRWPEDFTAGYYDNDPTLPLIGYEITHAPGNPLQSMGIPLANPVYQYNDGEYEVYRYEIPWVPIDPSTLPDYDANQAYYWACLLARIDSSQDPMFDEQIGSAWSNIGPNNNIAMRNTGYSLISNSPPPNNPLVGLNIVSNEPNNNTFNDHDITMTIHPNAILQDPNDFFDLVNVTITMSDDFLDAWASNGNQGTGFDWVDATTIRPTSTDFVLESVKLEKYKHHRVFVQADDIQPFDNLGFNINMHDLNGCINGSQEYILIGELNPNFAPIGEEDNLNEGEAEAFANAITIAPNPVVNNLVININESISDLRLIDFTGSSSSLQIMEESENSMTIDISSLKTGIHFVAYTVKSGKQEFVKFIKL